MHPVRYWNWQVQFLENWLEPITPLSIFYTSAMPSLNKSIEIQWEHPDDIVFKVVYEEAEFRGIPFILNMGRLMELNLDVFSIRFLNETEVSKNWKALKIWILKFSNNEMFEYFKTSDLPYLYEINKCWIIWK